MANEFIARNGIISKNNSIITGSLEVTQGITGSFLGNLNGTSSWSSNSISSSHSLTNVSSSYALSSSYSRNSTSASYLINPSTLQQVTTAGASTSNPITISTENATALIINSTISGDNDSYGISVSAHTRGVDVDGALTGLNVTNTGYAGLYVQNTNYGALIEGANAGVSISSPQTVGLDVLLSTNSVPGVRVQGLGGYTGNAIEVKDSIGQTAFSINQTGRVLATSFTGSLFGTASYARNGLSSSHSQNSTSASYANNALSSSYSLTSVSSSYSDVSTSSSYSNNSTSASYALSSLTSSYAESSLSSQTSSYVNTLNQTVTLSGILQLERTEDPGGLNNTSSYFFVSSSNDNISNNLQYRNKGVLWETHWLEERADSGIVWGGVLTHSGSTMYITPGAGLIVNHNATTSSHGETVPTYVPFGPITASAAYIATAQATYLLIDTDGSLIQQTSPFTPQQYNEKLPLGYIFNLTTSSISSYADARVTTYGQDEQQDQFIRAFGPLKISGYDLTPQSGSLKISIASGRTYRAGGFYSQNPDNPSIYDSTNISTGSLVRIYRDPSAIGGFKATLNGIAPFTDIDPTKWDDGSGTLQTVSSGSWTIQRLFQGVTSNITYVYYGQNTYSSLAAAVQSITTEAFEESETSQVALPFIGYIITKGNTTDLGDVANNKLINSGLFRNTAGSSGGGGAAAITLNDLSDVNIVGGVTGQALLLNAGVWENGTINNVPSSSYSQTSTSASYSTNSLSSSYAVTASYVTPSLIPPIGSSEIFRGRVHINNSTTTITTADVTVSVTGTVLAVAVANTDISTKQIRARYYSTTVSTGRYTGVRGSALLFYIHGGFRYVCGFRIADTAYSATCQQFYGLAGQTVDLNYGGAGNIQLETLTNLIGVGNNGTDSNLHIYHNDASGTCTKVDLGAGFPSNRPVGAQSATIYNVELYNAPLSTSVHYKVTNNETGEIAIGTLTTDLPLTTQGLNFYATRTMGSPSVTSTGQFELTRLGVYSQI